MKKLALFGGEPVLNEAEVAKVQVMKRWPIITQEDEDAALNVIRSNNYSGTDITEAFEKELKEYRGEE